MNANEADSPPPEAAAADATAPEGAVVDKPKRKRAPRKVAAGAEAPAEVAAEVEGAVEAVAGVGVEPPPAAAQVDRTEPASSEATQGAGAASAAAAPGQAIETGSTTDGQTGAEAGADAGVDGEAGTGSRRGRNRRRGRRGAERGESTEADVDVSAEGGDSGAGQPLDAPAAIRLPAPEAAEVFAQVLSGAYDEEPAPTEAAEPALPPKRVLAAEPDAPKLHKVLAQAGVGSRRDLEQMITEGRVTVNGEPAHTGQRISFGDRLAVDGKPVRVRIAPPPPRVLAYHKPAGEVVTHDDPQQRPTVFRRLPRLQHGKWQSVGRLDINTEGLLLFTNSGELANQLMHPRFGVEREYAVRSLGLLEPEARARLLEGVDIDGQRAAFKSIEDGGGEGVNHWYRVVITEGRNREVRKLFEAVGHAVSRLIRIRYGSVVLPYGLKRGVWVDLDENDLRTLRRLASGPRPEREEQNDGGARRGRNRRSGRRGQGGDRGPRP
ncbi:MAG TPA: pseudouridine synthase, partial [Rubrivivax sp.]|nr:pseudouridine synthase [Rubrivivax sp.]